MLVKGLSQSLGIRTGCARPLARVAFSRQFISTCIAVSTSSPVANSEPLMGAADDVIAGLEPAPLWHFFKDLTQIPRPSKQEERVLQYLKDFAAARQLPWRQDAVGNLVISRPGSGGGEQAPTVVIQGHVDMVCEKDPSLAHDFSRDPLTLRREGDWLLASGTTLGADNGIGVAAALALLDSPSTALLPPLECLFTVDEETGLTGAFGISPDLLTGRTMLNLDTEDWGDVFIGCAGGGDMQLVLEMESCVLRREQRESMEACRLQLGGLLGGHSGLNIGEGRGNAVQLLGRALTVVSSAVGEGGWRLLGVGGGDKRNAIARDAFADILVTKDKLPAATAAVHSLYEQLRTEYGTLETGLSLSLSPAPAAADLSSHAGPAAVDGAVESSSGCEYVNVVASDDVARLMALIRALPHGPLKYSHSVSGLVETSNNVASLKELPSKIPGKRRWAVVTSTRSSLMPALEATRDVIQGLAQLAGCVEVSRGRAYPGWQPDLNSRVLQVTLDAYKELLGSGRNAKVGAIHAGLECGILGEKFPGMDMVSFGPTIKGAHSPEERVQVSTVEPFWRLTVTVLERLAALRH